MDDTNGESLGERIARIRDGRDLSINRLARESGVAYSHIFNTEKHGSIPSRERMKAIADILDPDGTEELMIYRDAEELVRLGYHREAAEVLARDRAEREKLLSEADPETRYEHAGRAGR